MAIDSFQNNFIPFENLITRDPGVLESLKKKFIKHKIRTNISHDVALHWPRDCRVLLASQKHLIPTPFPSKEDKLFHSLLPQTMLHFITEKQNFSGHGLTETYQERAKTLAIKYFKKPFHQGLSCIEGGNCQIFKGKNGETKAIVGYSSLILTVQSLVEKNISLQKQEKLNKYFDEHPQLQSPDSLRLGRNFVSVLQGKDCHPEEALDPEEEALWTQPGRKVEATFALAKEVIAEELEIPLERIAFVFQERFHIDMELFAGPDDLVFLHDEQLMLNLQEKIDFPFPFLKNTRRYSESHLSLNQKILEENTKILEQIGCRAVRVPGVLTADYTAEDSPSYAHILTDWVGEERPLPKQYQARVERGAPKFVNLLNFMNGLFFSHPEPRFITTGSPKQHPITQLVKKAFKETIQAECPNMRISFLQAPNLPAHLLVGSGGVHCLTSHF